MEEKSVIVNQELVLDCPAEGIPAPKIIWTRQGQMIPRYGNPGVRISNNGRQLRVINAQILDAGDYSCTATNVAGNASIGFSVTVLGNICRFQSSLIHSSDGSIRSGRTAKWL